MEFPHLRFFHIFYSSGFHIVEFRFLVSSCARKFFLLQKFTLLYPRSNIQNFFFFWISLKFLLLKYRGFPVRVKIFLSNSVLILNNLYSAFKGLPLSFMSPLWGIWPSLTWGCHFLLDLQLRPS